jgi:hypothetical protein
MSSHQRANGLPATTNSGRRRPRSSARRGDSVHPVATAEGGTEAATAAADPAATKDGPTGDPYLQDVVLMIEAHSPKITSDDDPRRCQRSTAHGQCRHVRIEGSEFCQMHVAGQASALKQEMARQYNVTRWKAKIDHFAGHSDFKSLREEIGVLRLLMETALNKCETDMDLLLYSNHISGMAMKIKEALVAAHKLESAMGMLLDRAATMQLTGEIVDIIGRYVDDEEKIRNIITDINASLVRIEAAGAANQGDA